MTAERNAHGEGARGTDLLDEALGRVHDPCSLTHGAPLSIVDMGLVRHRHVAADGTVEVTVAVTGPGCLFVGHIVDAVEREIRAEFGADAVVVVEVDTSHVWTEADLSDDARVALAARRRHTVVDLGLRPRMWEDTEMGVPA